MSTLCRLWLRGVTFPGYVTASKAYGINALNQYTSVGSASQGYDANGNLTSDGSTTYTYDVENRLTATSTGASLTYDPLGRLYRITDATSDERYAYAGDQRIAAYDASGALTDRYVFGPGDDNVLLAYSGSGSGSGTTGGSSRRCNCVRDRLGARASKAIAVDIRGRAARARPNR